MLNSSAINSDKKGVMTVQDIVKSAKLKQKLSQARKSTAKKKQAKADSPVVSDTSEKSKAIRTQVIDDFSSLERGKQSEDSIQFVGKQPKPGAEMSFLTPKRSKNVYEMSADLSNSQTQ